MQNLEFLANYVPKCQMGSGPFGPIFIQMYNIITCIIQRGATDKNTVFVEPLLNICKVDRGVHTEIYPTFRLIPIFFIEKKNGVVSCICTSFSSEADNSMEHKFGLVKPLKGNYVHVNICFISYKTHVEHNLLK